ELGVPFHDRDQPPHRLSEGALGLSDGTGAAGGAGPGPGGRDALEEVALVLHVPLDGGDQVRNEGVAALELYVDLGPGARGLVPRRHQAVVKPDGHADDHRDHREGEKSAHGLSPVASGSCPAAPVWWRIRLATRPSATMAASAAR